jgi:hypothetical protein
VTDQTTSVSRWLPIDMAADHVRDAASTILMEPRRSRVRLYYGPEYSLYAFWFSGGVGTPPTFWCALPDLPLQWAAKADLAGLGA